MLVQAKCPNCGGVLSVDKDNDAAICQYCKTPFIVEKAINNFKIEQMNIANANINVINGESVEEKYNQCMKLINAGSYNNAKNIQASIIKEYPSDYRGYYLEALILTQNMTKRPANGYDSFPSKATESFNTAVSLAPEGTISNDLIQKFKSYKVEYINKTTDMLNASTQRSIQRTQEYQAQTRLYILVTVILIIVSFLLIALALS